MEKRKQETRYLEVLSHLGGLLTISILAILRLVLQFAFISIVYVLTVGLFRTLSAILAHFPDHPIQIWGVLHVWQSLAKFCLEIVGMPLFCSSSR